MNYWIWPVTIENWKVVLDKNIWSVGTQTKTKKVSKDDFIIFYVKGTGTFKGIFKVISNWYDATSPIWSEELEQNIILYPFQCKLEPILLGDAVFNELISKLSFTKDRKVPQLALQGHISGPGNNAQPILDIDYSLIQENMKEPTKPINQKINNKSEHEEIISKLIDVGISLGFDTFTSQDYTLVAKGSVVDLVWQIKIANLGTMRYVFEVQSKGSIKSLINNLLQAMNNPMVKKVVAVSDKEQLKKIHTQVNQMMAISETAKSMFLLLDIEKVNNFSKILPEFTSFKEALELS